MSTVTSIALRAPAHPAIRSRPHSPEPSHSTIVVVLVVVVVASAVDTVVTARNLLARVYLILQHNLKIMRPMMQHSTYSCSTLAAATLQGYVFSFHSREW